MVGGGPAGAAAAFWLASAGHSVTVVERRTLPRGKACGDVLTPRGVRQLTEMGLGDALANAHRHDGVRITGRGREMVLGWPAHPDYPQHGYVIRRSELDQLALRHAGAAGATVLEGHDAIRPLVSRGFVRGALVQDPTGASREIMARYVVVADGANSRFGRLLGTTRSAAWPYGASARSYWPSPRHAETLLETAVDLTDSNGRSIPGFGWVFPMGDGTVNVGVGLLSTFRDFKAVNTNHLLASFTERITDRWQIDPGQAVRKAVAARVPMGGSVAPTAGPTYLVVGDAAGAVSPLNGDGIGYAYETGRIAADVLHDALSADDASALQQYSKRLDSEFGQYFKVARLFARMVGRPLVMRELTRVGIHNRTVMDWMLRIMCNELRDDERGAAELVFGAASKIARMAPA